MNVQIPLSTLVVALIAIAPFVVYQITRHWEAREDRFGIGGAMRGAVFLIAASVCWVGLVAFFLGRWLR